MVLRLLCCSWLIIMIITVIQTETAEKMGELHVKENGTKMKTKKNDFQNNITYYSYYRGMYYDSALPVDDPDVTEDRQLSPHP